MFTVYKKITSNSLLERLRTLFLLLLMLIWIVQHLINKFRAEPIWYVDKLNLESSLPSENIKDCKKDRKPIRAHMIL